MTMRYAKMQPLLKLLVTATLLNAMNAAEDRITTIIAASKTETEKLRAALVAQINSESVRIPKKNEDGNIMVLDADSVSVEGREFKVNSKLSPSHGQCRYGPVQNEGTRPIYKYKRTLSRTEVSRLESNDIPEYGLIEDMEPGDTIETDTLKYNGLTVEKTYKLLSPIKTVSFSCPSNTFCCGLFCCSQPIKSFIDSLPNDYEARWLPVNATLIDNIKMSTSPILEVDDVANGTVARQCEILFEEGNYFSGKSANSLYYQCPMTEKPQCCNDQLCCKIPEPTAAGSSNLFTWGANFIFGFVSAFALISYCYLKHKKVTVLVYSRMSNA